MAERELDRLVISNNTFRVTIIDHFRAELLAREILRCIKSGQYEGIPFNVQLEEPRKAPNNEGP